MTADLTTQANHGGIRVSKEMKYRAQHMKYFKDPEWVKSEEYEFCLRFLKKLIREHNDSELAKFDTGPKSWPERLKEARKRAKFVPVTVEDIRSFSRKAIIVWIRAYCCMSLLPEKPEKGVNPYRLNQTKVARFLYRSPSSVNGLLKLARPKPTLKPRKRKAKATGKPSAEKSP